MVLQLCHYSQGARSTAEMFFGKLHVSSVVSEPPKQGTKQEKLQGSLMTRIHGLTMPWVYLGSQGPFSPCGDQISSQQSPGWRWTMCCPLLLAPLVMASERWTRDQQKAFYKGQIRSQRKGLFKTNVLYLVFIGKSFNIKMKSKQSREKSWLK